MKWDLRFISNDDVSGKIALARVDPDAWHAGTLPLTITMNLQNFPFIVIERGTGKIVMICGRTEAEHAALCASCAGLALGKMI